MKTSLDYWIEIDRQKERALKRIEEEKEQERKLKKPKGGNNGRNERRRQKGRQDKQERASKMIMLTDMDMVQVYINKRLVELADMIAVYGEADEPPTVDLLARRAELERLESKLKEYKDVQEADS